MNILAPKSKKHRFFCWVSYALILVLVGFIPTRLAIARTIAPHPQSIFTLGGGSEREKFTAQFAQRYPLLEIWVSSGTSPNISSKIFQAEEISKTRLHIDRRAVDTVTNFTSLVNDFKKRKFHHIYLITDDYHMRRAKAIAIFVFGSQGIAFTPVAIPTDKPVESWWRVLRDVCRALLWIFTKRTGASLNQ